MKKHFSLLFSFLLALNTFAQNPFAEKYAAEINPKVTKKHLSILASDRYKGRETGKKGAEMAAAYLAKEFKKIGLIAPVNGSYHQDVELIETTFHTQTFDINNSSLKAGKDYKFSGSGEARTVQSNEVLFIGNPTEIVLKDIFISGKVILVFEPDIASEAAKQEAYLKSKNPVLLFIIKSEIHNRKNAHYSGASLSVRNGIRESLPVKENTPAIVWINKEASKTLLSKSGKTLEELQKERGTQKTLRLNAEINISYGPVKRELKSSNVLGYLEGTDLKDELLVYSAHYDHIGMNPEGGRDRVFNGADDDGSGTSGVLAIAKAFAMAKKEGHGPRRSILFLMFTGEEKNLLGSEYYSLNPVFPMARTIANLNVDMIGRIGFDYKNSPDARNYCFLIGADRLSTDLHKISENANHTYTKLKIDYKHNAPADQIYYWSDHYNFARNGVPVIFYYNGKHEDYHKGSDEISKIDFELLSKRAKLAYFTGWDLVNRDQRPVIDVIQVKRY